MILVYHSHRHHRVVYGLFADILALKPGDEPFLKILDPRDATLRIADHFPEQICEACLAQLLRPAAIQGPVVDSFASRGIAQARRWAWLCVRGCGCEGRLGCLGGCHDGCGIRV